MNINPNVWGRSTWDFFYYVALSYPKNPTENDKSRFKQFYTITGSMVPCKKCRINFMKHLDELPIDNFLDSSYDLFSWVTYMDNKVRILNNKTEKTVEETFQHYMGTIQEHKSLFNFSKKETLLIGLGVAIVFLLLIKKFKI